jgi:hypothetical protein
VTVFGCYGHDVLEATPISGAELTVEALAIFTEHRQAEALVAVELCVQRCYTDDEYAMERTRRKAVGLAAIS